MKRCYDIMTHSVGCKLLERIEQLRLWLANMDHRLPLVDKLWSHNRAEETRSSARNSCLVPVTPPPPLRSARYALLGVPDLFSLGCCWDISFSPKHTESGL